MTILGLRGEDMRTFKVNMELVISEADYKDMVEDNDWSLEGEVHSWLSDLGFGIMKLDIDEDKE